MGDTPELGNLGDPVARDVLAAEEFAVPAADPSIGHPPVELPEDPSGISAPHDVLAAEEFALPASAPHAWAQERRTRSVALPAGVIVAALGVLIVILRRRR
jgi:hypothetical protein